MTSPGKLLEQAQWIQAYEPETPTAGQRPAYEFRKTFELRELPGEALLAVTAHGIYEAFLNGVRIGDEELTPGLSTYTKTLYVQQYDVTSHLQAGSNELLLVVSDGWYRGRCGPARVPDAFGTDTAVLAQLDMHLPDYISTIATGPSWEACIGVITRADLMDGQTTDFTRTGKTLWTPVILATDPATADRARIAFSPAPPVRRVAEYAPVTVTRHSSGRQIIDFGQNLNGWVRLTQLGPAGARLTLTHGEALDDTGDLTMDHLAYTAYPDPAPLPTGQIDTVVSRGDKCDVFEPRHTTHGFRYVALDGLDEDLRPENITAVLVRSDLRATGNFTSSDDRLNRLYDIAVASWRANTCDVPTDCPQRERWGYTGDYQIFVRSAAFLEDIDGFSRKWLKSLADEQLDTGCITNVAPNVGNDPSPAIPISFDGSAGWGDAATVVPWQLYQTYGDMTVLQDNIVMMARWVDYAAGIAATQRHSSRETARPEPAAHEQYLWDAGFHWGEWAEPGGEFDFFADNGIIATAYLHRSAFIVSETFRVLGEAEKAEQYCDLAERVKDAWRTEFITSDGRLTVETQANYVRGLAFGLIPEDLQESAAVRLVELIRAADTHLSTGFLSTPYLLPTLADHGHLDLAYELLFQDSEPSWMTMLDRGATTIWESWAGVDADGTAHESLNHYSKGAVITFMHEYIAGIKADPSAPGYRRFAIAPRPGHGLTSASAWLETHNGHIRSGWKILDGHFELTVDVPAGTVASVCLPSGSIFEAPAGRHEYKERTTV